MALLIPGLIATMSNAVLANILNGQMFLYGNSVGGLKETSNFTVNDDKDGR